MNQSSRTFAVLTEAAKEQPGQRLLWVIAGTAADAHDRLDRLRIWLGDDVAQTSHSRGVVELKNGSTIRVEAIARVVDAERLRGLSLDIAATTQSPGKARDATVKVLRPAIADRGGYLMGVP